MGGVEGCVEVDGEEGGEEGGSYHGKKSKRSGGWLAVVFEGEGVMYFLTKWGIKRRPGIRRNAGKVIRLKIPKIITDARIAEAKELDLCCKRG